jgi:acyl carrier protein
MKNEKWFVVLIFTNLNILAMETMEEIKGKIRQYILETTYASPDSVKDDSLIFVEGIFDSMGFILLINFIEETFDIKAKDTELLEDNFESIDAISRFVAGKVSQAA